LAGPEHKAPNGDEGTSGHYRRPRFLSGVLSTVAICLAVVMLIASIVLGTSYIAALLVLPARGPPPELGRALEMLCWFIIGVATPSALIGSCVNRKGLFPPLFAVWNILAVAFIFIDLFIWRAESTNWLVTAFLLLVWSAFSIPFFLRAGMIRKTFVK
jgi:hypothetical protein